MMVAAPITLVDLPSQDFFHWHLADFPRQLDALRQTAVCVNGVSVTVDVKYVGGDHADLWSQFSKMGGQGHRSAFCSTPRDESVARLHQCKRLSMRALDAKGFSCPIASAFKNEVYCITPPLHDTKNCIVILLHILPDGFRSLPADVQQLTQENAPIKNLKGAQAREALNTLCHLSNGVPLTMGLLMQGLVFFRYQSIACRFYLSDRLEYQKEMLYSLVMYHALMYLLEWRIPGMTTRKGHAYLHSMGHWFDEVDALPIQCTDELQEQGNSTRKMHSARVGTNFEHDQMRYEVARVSVCKPLPGITTDPPKILACDALKLCKCFYRDQWKGPLSALLKRISKLGLLPHVTKISSDNELLFHVGEGVPRDCFTMCVCRAKRWDIPERGKCYAPEE